MEQFFCMDDYNTDIEIGNLITPATSIYVSDIDLLLVHFDFLWPHAYPNRSRESYLEHRKTVEDGTWNNLGGLLEHAIHAMGNLIKHNTTGRDYTDDSDAKLVSVRTSSKGTNYSAPVTNIHRKKGYLRVCCYERKLNKHYFFLIPYSAYCHIGKSSNIEIPFDLNGTPKRINKCAVNWWNYEKSSFLEICCDITNIR